MAIVAARNAAVKFGHFASFPAVFVLSFQELSLVTIPSAFAFLNSSQSQTRLKWLIVVYFVSAT